MRFTIIPKIEVPKNVEELDLPFLTWNLWLDDIVKDFAGREYEVHEKMGTYATKQAAERAATIIAELYTVEEYTYEV